MKTLTLLLTAVAVSLDSFCAGFSLSLNKKTSPILPAAVTLMTFLMCLATSLATALLRAFDEKTANFAGAILLTALGATCLFRKDNASANLTPVSIGESLTVGFAVGLDAAIANLSLAGNGLELVAPVVFAAMHYLAVTLGQLLARRVTLAHTNVISAAVLFVIALTKIA